MRITSYWQLKNKEIVTFVKDMLSNYNSLISLTGELPFGATIMEDLIKKNVGTARWPTDLAVYITLNDLEKAILCEAYKQAVLSKMLIMGYNIDKVRLDLEEHMKMSTGDNNPYPTTLA